jgi:undecaprenyl-diphosphatase
MHRLGLLGMVLLVAVTALVIDARVAGSAMLLKHPALDAVVGVLNPIGSGVILLVACAALGLLCRWLRLARLHDAAWLGALAFVTAGLLEFSLKHLVGRARPDAALSTLSLNGPSFAPDVDSFPSGHATSVFAVATALASFYPRLAGPLYGLAAAIALGRIYLERHYLSDVLAGAFIGIAVATWLLRSRHGLPRWMRSAAGEPSD